MQKFAQRLCTDFIQATLTEEIMNIEQTIKKQSLALLAKDNWGNAIGGFLIAVLPTVLLMILDEVISNIINLFVV